MDVADDEALRAYIPRRAGELKSPHELELLRRVHPQARGGGLPGGWGRAVGSTVRAHPGPS